MFGTGNGQDDIFSVIPINVPGLQHINLHLCSSFRDEALFLVVNLGY